ncbi:ATP-binding protein [Vagococcus carniphilus]|uniref:ATP-binding protein n=1 Tax=Vagococcus carniphilus TaxID=218144 RepID=UPI0028910CEB|nr:ATP-binding protein [Vagococcus carniphilus]MDT2864661.1 ATP-binding protein [Vagococcus carniphilus]
MAQENTTTFSSPKDVFKSRLTVSDETCPIHNIELVSAFGREPICIECKRTALEERENTLVEEIMKEQNRINTYDWLNKHSIYLDQTLQHVSFDNYKTNDNETKANKEKALKIAREYYQGANYNTIFTGKPGTGKSHLAMSIAKVVNEHSQPYKKCLFTSIDEVMRKIKDSFNHRDSKYTEEYVTNLLTSADLLVIDDLGAETGAIFSDKQATDFTTKVLYSIMNGRMNKPTIITTNLTSKEMAKMYDQKLISRFLRGAEGHAIKFDKTNDKRISVEF